MGLYVNFQFVFYFIHFQANGFVSEINCDPSELKERFLRVMQKLDEYMYLITDFNLAMAQTGMSNIVQVKLKKTSPPRMHST